MPNAFPLVDVMRAVEFDSYGRPDVLTFRPVPPPELKSGEVLVRMVATSVNPKDTFVRKGRFRHITGECFPHRSGYDGAGIVIFSDSPSFGPGDRVFGMLNSWRGGAAAEVVAWPASELAIAPTAIQLADAAAIPLAALTALQSLRDHLDLKPQQSVLINGATGGVGSFAIQIARDMGAQVTAICSLQSTAHAFAMGAHNVHNYETAMLPGDRFDAVFDVFGNLSDEQVASVTDTRSRYVTTVPSASNLKSALMADKRPRTQIVNVQSRAADLAALTCMVDTGRLKTVVDARFQISEVVAAHEQVERKHTRGKILLEFPDQKVSM